MKQRLYCLKLKSPKIVKERSRTRNKILMKLLLSVTLFFFLFSATTICEEPFVSNFYHKGCFSYEYCLSSQVDNSKKSSSAKLPLPINHCYISSSCVHNFTKSESPKPLIQADIPTLTITYNYSILESNLIKSIFNPPRPLI